MFCGECGTKNNPDNLFCEKCGKRLDEEREMLKEMKKEEEKPVKKEEKEEPVEEKKKEVPKPIKEEMPVPPRPVPPKKEIDVEFNPRKYGKYIRHYENSIITTYIIWIGIGIIFSIIILSGALTVIDDDFYFLAIFPPIIGLMIARAITFALKIKVQEMKWNLDFHNKYID